MYPLYSKTKILVAKAVEQSKTVSTGSSCAKDKAPAHTLATMVPPEENSVIMMIMDQFSKLVHLTPLHKMLSAFEMWSIWALFNLFLSHILHCV